MWAMIPSSALFFSFSFPVQGFLTWTSICHFVFCPWLKHQANERSSRAHNVLFSFSSAFCFTLQSCESHISSYINHVCVNTKRNQNQPIQMHWLQYALHTWFRLRLNIYFFKLVFFFIAKAILCFCKNHCARLSTIHQWSLDWIGAKWFLVDIQLNWTLGPQISLLYRLLTRK